MATNPFLDVLRMYAQMEAQRRLQREQLQAQQEMQRQMLEAQQSMRRMEIEAEEPVRQARLEAMEQQKRASEMGMAATHAQMIAGGAVPTTPVKIRTPDGVEYEMSPESVLGMQERQKMVELNTAQKAQQLQMQMFGFDPANPSHRSVFGLVGTAMTVNPGVSPEIHLASIQGAIKALDEAKLPPETFRPLKAALEQQAKVLEDQLEKDRSVRTARIVADRAADTQTNAILGSLVERAVNRSGGRVNQPYELGSSIVEMMANDEEFNRLLDSLGVSKDPAFRQSLRGRLAPMVLRWYGGSAVEGLMRESLSGR